MNKKIIYVIIIIAIILPMFIFSTKINNLINNSINKMDRSCQEDSDCKVILGADCHVCNCNLEPVNKNWNPICPFPMQRILCETCPSFHNVKCADGTCILDFGE